MLFYELAHNSAYQKKWTFAASIHPKSHVLEWHCPECGRAATYPAGAFDVTIEGGSAFPDFLGCGAYPLLIVSGRVVSAFKAAGIECFQGHAVGIAGVRETHLRCEDAPAYFRIEIAGECMIDFAASGATLERICPRCGEVKFQPPVIRQFAIIDGSWDGCDLFRDHRYFPRVSFTTKRVADLVRTHALTNCRLERMA